MKKTILIITGLLIAAGSFTISSIATPDNTGKIEPGFVILESGAWSVPDPTTAGGIVPIAGVYVYRCTTSTGINPLPQWGSGQQLTNTADAIVHYRALGFKISFISQDGLLIHLQR